MMEQVAGQERQDNCTHSNLHQMATGLHRPVVIGGLKVFVDGVDEISFDIICVFCMQIAQAVNG